MQKRHSIFFHGRTSDEVKQKTLKTLRNQEHLQAQKVIKKYIQDGSKGDLNLAKYKGLRSLPDELKYVGGSLNLSNSQIQSLPNDLKVGGDLHLHNTPIQSLPDSLKVRGTLWLNDTPIQSLPDGLKVGHNLILSNTQIQSLPDGLKVGGSLGLYNTPIQSLPDGLKVGGDLHLYSTPIQSLPDGLEVGGDLWVHEAPLGTNYTAEEIKQMAPGIEGKVDGAKRSIQENKEPKRHPIFFHGRTSDEVKQKTLKAFRNQEHIQAQKVIKKYIQDGSKGSLDLRDYRGLRSIPNELKYVEGRLVLTETQIQSLPDGLKVEDSLWLQNTQIQALPDDLKVGRNLYLSDTPIQSLPDRFKVNGNLDIIGCKQLKSLPDDLEVKGELWVYESLLGDMYTEEEIRQMAPGIKGKIGGAKETIKENEEPKRHPIFYHGRTPDEVKQKTLKALRNQEHIQAQEVIKKYIQDGSKGSLDLRDYRGLRSLPNELKYVGGPLILSRTQIQSLPDGLKVGGNLYLNRIPIQSLPDGLKVGGILWLNNTPIQSLPKDLKVGRDLSVLDSFLGKNYTEEEIRQMAPGIQGKIYGAQETIKENEEPKRHPIFYHGRTPDEVKQKTLKTLRNQEHIKVQKVIKKYIQDGSKGDLNLRGYRGVRSLPDELKYVGGYLNLSGTQIQSLPEDLKVGGILDLCGTPIQSLPDGLEIEGVLWLNNTPIQSLPDGLEVRGLWLNETLIQSLPKDLKVGGELWVLNSFLGKNYTEEEIKQMAPGIEGKIFGAKKTMQENQESKRHPIFYHGRTSDEVKQKALKALRNQQHIKAQKVIKKYIQDGSKGALTLRTYKGLRSLPDELKYVGGYLDIANTQIQSLPDGLQVNGSLYLRLTPIQSLPNGLKVKGSLDLEGTAIEHLPNDLEVGRLNLRKSKVKEIPKGVVIHDIAVIDPTVKYPPEIEDKVGLGQFVTISQFKKIQKLPEVIAKVGRKSKKGRGIEIPLKNIESKELENLVNQFKAPTTIPSYTQLKNQIISQANWFDRQLTIKFTTVYVFISIISPRIVIGFILKGTDDQGREFLKTHNIGKIHDEFLISSEGQVSIRGKFTYTKDYIHKELKDRLLHTLFPDPTNQTSKPIPIRQLMTGPKSKEVYWKIGRKKRGGHGIQGQAKDLIPSLSTASQDNITRAGHQYNVTWGDTMVFDNQDSINIIARSNEVDANGDYTYFDKYGFGRGGNNRVFKDKNYIVV